jgi:hypothetical protein
MTTFSFIENPVVHVLKHAHDLLPGIEKVIAIYYCSESNEIRAKYRLDTLGNDNKIEDLSFEDASGIIDKWRKTNSYYSWYKKEDTPFEIQKKKKHVQMNVFNELDNTILSLGFLNEHDQKYDLLLFYFNPTLSNFGVSDSDKVLNQENKKIIGFLLYNSLRTIIETSKSDLSVLNTNNENTKSLVKRYAQSKEDLEKSKNNYGLSLTDLCCSYLKEFSDSSSRFNYILTEDALNKIKSYQGDISALKNVIQKSISFVNNLYFDTNETDIYISEEYLNFESIGAGNATKPQEVQLYDRYSKTILLLDKLENAARDVVARNMDITSANVGNACSTPITAPAISDAVKKHRNKIIYLLNKYPDRWKLIRTEFRPVRNVLSSRPHMIEKSA